MPCKERSTNWRNIPTEISCCPMHPQVCAAFDGSLQRGLLSVFFFFPYLARVSHPVSVHQPLCDYIAEALHAGAFRHTEQL